MATAEVQRQRAEKGLPVEESSMHLVFSGNPGTGKTTAARLIGQAYHALGLLEKPDVSTVSRADLVAEYEGQSAAKTRRAFEKAKGGVLFVDEAYDLVNSDRDDFGKEALTELIQQAENNRDNTVIVLAGYTGPTEKMLASNPGAKSRFPRTGHIAFPDYSAAEKTKMFSRSLKKGKYTLDNDAKAEAVRVISQMPSGEGTGNARDVRNFYEATVKAQHRRVAGKDRSRSELSQITAADVKAAERMLR